MRLAFDKASARRYDADGRLHVTTSHISKSTVNPYYGSEIPGYVELGLDPGKIYKLLRDPNELAAGASTFNNLPILSTHVPVTVDSPRPDLVIGSIGSDVVFNAPYLDASLCFWDQKAIAAIETSVIQELSCAYRYDPVMEPGEYDGEAYDGKMTNIRGNHLALVEVGRAGPDVVVADHNPFKDTPAMKQTALGKALIVALSAASPKLALDSALPKLVGGVTKAKFNKEEIKKSLLAMDTDFDPQQLDNIIDALLGVEQNPEPTVLPDPVKDDGDLASFLKAKGLSDEDIAQAVSMTNTRAMDDDMPGETKPQDVTKEDMAAAMDSVKKEMQVQFKALEQAKADVRGVVGDVLGMDSAEAVYRFALDHLAIDHKDVPAAGLRAFVKLASEKRTETAPTRVAMDTETTQRFKGIGRFTQL